MPVPLFFSPTAALRREAKGQVSALPRSSLFPAGPFSPLAGFSRLAPGHYLIFRLETSHPQEKRSGLAVVEAEKERDGRWKGGHRAPEIREVLSRNNICIRGAPLLSDIEPGVLFPANAPERVSL